MSNLIKTLYNSGYLVKAADQDNLIYHLARPCRFEIKQNIVDSLKSRYLPDEEIGGILWINPIKIDDEYVFMIDKVSYIRNSIEDTVYKDKVGNIRTRKDTYLSDAKTYSEEVNKVLAVNCLPLKFHSHPTQGKSVIESLNKQEWHTETSDQDVIESSKPLELGNDSLLLPRALIVGNGDFSNDIFIGLYGGFIAPNGFGESKEIIRTESIEKYGDLIFSNQISDNAKIALGVGAILLLIFLIRHSKYSIPVIIALAAATPVLLTNTSVADKPNYFNRLSYGSAVIYIP